MGGDTAGATRIAETMMPPGAATALQGFFTQLPRLSAVDKAFAVHFGEVIATPQRLADARLPHEAPLPIAAPVVVAQAPPPTVERRGKRDRRRRETVQVAALVLPPATPPLPAPPAYQPPVFTAPAAATPVRDRPLTSGEQLALTAGGNRVPTGRVRSAYVAPPTSALSAAEQRSLASAGDGLEGTRSHRADRVRAAPPAAAVASRPAGVPVSIASAPACSCGDHGRTSAAADRAGRDRCGGAGERGHGERAAAAF